MQALKTCKRKTLDDEFYTLYKDVKKQFDNYDLSSFNIICPCDSSDSQIYKYLKDNKYHVSYSSQEWRDVNYNLYDLVITNPPFSQVREFIRYLIKCNIKFVIIVSDVLRYSIKNGKAKFDTQIYHYKDAQKFLRPDGSIKMVHCGWISNFDLSLYKIKLKVEENMLW